MIIFVVLLCVVAVWKMRRNTGQPLSMASTTSMNGVFVVLIVISHAAPYLSLDSGLLNDSYWLFKKMHDQLIVVPFLLFSGYGVMQQIKAREDYLKQLPRNRILKTLVKFDLAVAVFAVVSIGILKNRYDLRTVLLSFVGWESVGNSNWYIFSILLMYLATWVGGLLGKRHRLVWFVSIFAICYLMLFWKSFTYVRWYYISTIMCYPAGMWVSLYEEEVFSQIRKHPVITILGLTIIFVVTALRRGNMVIMNMHSVAFGLMLVWFMRFVRLENKVIHFLGKYSFGIYILQRLPMMILSRTPIVTKYYLFVPLCLGITILLAVVFDRATDRFWKAITLPKNAHRT